MAFVVTESCIQCKFTDCVAACPVDCFRDGPNFLVIDPDECIDCGACVPECPVEAIFDAASIPAEWVEYVELNATLALLWPSITDARDPLPTAEAWRDAPGKKKWLELDAQSAQALARDVQGPAPAQPPEGATASAPLVAKPKAPPPAAYQYPPEPPEVHPATAKPPNPSPTSRAPRTTTGSGEAPEKSAGSDSLPRRLARKVLPSSVRGSLKGLLGRR